MVQLSAKQSAKLCWCKITQNGVFGIGCGLAFAAKFAGYELTYKTPDSVLIVGRVLMCRVCIGAAKCR
jgi:hypothetical protein